MTFNYMEFCLACGDLEAVENGTYEFSFDDELKKFVADLVCNERFQILPAELNRLICNVETRMWEGDIGKCYTGKLTLRSALSNFVACVA